MFRRAKAILKPGEAENPFFLSFSDLMAGLLAVFILVLIFTLFQLEKRKDELRVSKIKLLASLKDIQLVQNKIYNSLKGVRARENALAVLLEEIKQDLKGKGIEVVIAENGTVLRILETEIQFPLGQYEIPSTYKISAKAIGSELLTKLKRPKCRELLDTVFIEGHTDSVSNFRVMGNWGLSTYRAISLWKFWTENPGKLTELKALRNSPLDSTQPSKLLFSVSGYADTRSTHGPLDELSLKADRPEDRRIDIRFTLVSSEKKNLKELKDNLTQMKKKTKALIDAL